MKLIRKALADLLVQSLNTQQMNHVGREIDSDFSIYEYSGFGEKIVIPRKVAADCVLSYFNSEERLLEYVAYMLARRGHGMSGGVIQLKGEDRLLKLLGDMGWIYDPQNARFYKDQRQEQSAGWGFMRQGMEYYFSFASLDVVSSSELVRTNVKTDVQATMGRMRDYINKHVEFWDGRVWYWYGDGGIAVFHGEHSAPMSVLAMVSILNYLPVFNIVENELRAENDIKLRIGMHYGSCIYKKDVQTISSADLRLVGEVEKKRGTPNGMAVSQPLFKLLAEEIRRSFHEGEPLEGLKMFQYDPL